MLPVETFGRLLEARRTIGITGYVLLVGIAAIAWLVRDVHAGTLTVIPLLMITLATNLRVALTTAAGSAIMLSTVENGVSHGGNMLSASVPSEAIVLALAFGIVVSVVESMRRYAVQNAQLRTSLITEQAAASRDPLTHVHNRAYFIKELREALSKMRPGELLAVLFADLDRFKAVNDAAGHPVGDQVLEISAHRLEHSLRSGDVVARIGGDEFAILLPHLKDRTEARNVVATIRAAFVNPCVIGPWQFDVGVTVGLALAPQDGTEPDALLAAADADMYRLKGRHTRRLRTGTVDMHGTRL